MKSSIEGGKIIMNTSYRAEDLPLEIEPEVREKCNN